MSKAVSLHSVGLIGRILAMLVATSAVAAIIFVSSAGRADDATMLIGNHPLEAENFHQIGEAEPGLPLKMEIRFAVRNRKALERLLAQQQNPASSDYHKWLTTGEFVKRFGPTAKQVAAVADWLTSEGFTVAELSSNAIEFSGSVALADRAFALRVAKFGDGSLYANTTDPVVPKKFAGLIASVRGLDNMEHAVALVHRYPAPSNVAPRTLKGLAPAELPLQLALAERESTPDTSGEPEAIVGGYQSFGPTDLRNFYDESIGAGSDGSGNCIAIVDVSDFLDATATTFTNQFSLPAINYTRVLQGSNPGIISGEYAESELDIQWAHVTAPGASINFYLGSDLVADISAAVNNNLCGAISISYGFCGVSSAFMTQTMDPIFQRAAAQGQSVFVSAGDQGAAGLTLNPSGNACVTGTTRGVNEMSADPNVTSVGGTQFTPNYVSGTDQGYTSESVWNDPAGSTGGGASQ